MGWREILEVANSTSEPPTHNTHKYPPGVNSAYCAVSAYAPTSSVLQLEGSDTLDEDAREYFQERAAIGEFDGGLSRKDTEAQAARRVFEYRLADGPGQWLVVLAKPGDGLAEITESLRGRFGTERVLEVRHHD